jgi:hypothetical protein
VLLRRPAQAARRTAVTREEGDRHVVGERVDGAAHRALELGLALADEVRGHRRHRPGGQARPRQGEDDDERRVVGLGQPRGVRQRLSSSGRAVEADENAPDHAASLVVNAAICRNFG